MPRDEHVLLESEEQRQLPHPRTSRKRHGFVEFPDRLRRRVLRLEIIDYFYLVVRVQRAEGVMAEYVLDLRFVDPSVSFAQHVAFRWLGATVLLVALAVGVGSRVGESAAPGSWLVACLVVSTLALGAALVCAYRTTDTLTIFSVHGRGKLFEHTGTRGMARALRPFLAKLLAHVRIASAARRPLKAQHLRDEMREHARLHQTGVLSTVEYEACKVRILAEHAPSQASSAQ
jgi:hypothetical protein